MEMTATTTENEQLIRDYIHHVINNKQLHRLGEFYTDDCKIRTTTGRQAHGLREYTLALQQVFTVFPDLYVTVNEVVVSGDNASFRITAQGTQHSEYESIQPSQPARPFCFEEAFFVRFKDEKITTVWILMDTHTLLQQLRTS
ncbi:ester cyclase [Larkinella terrae]|uniref:Ester cyclase n=1 Tax=Larkinella terrae TaxID=2025311 RepID=A0A7K0EF84_9BACT|nr:ester cyclase [Larkinella terrae]MRS60405.1 hypothetical protein [Larkinella terrae]